MSPRRIEVEFGLKITEVTPEELAPLLETLARLAKGGTLRVSPETQRVLATHAPLAFAPVPARRRGRPTTLTSAGMIAALTVSRGSVPKAALALGRKQNGLYKFCQKHQITPAAFRPPKEAAR